MEKKRSKRSQGRAGVKRTVEFSPDYTDMKKDLKQIAILAASFFVVLVALSFILN